MKYVKLILILLLIFLCGCGKNVPVEETALETQAETTEATPKGTVLEITTDMPYRHLSQEYKLQDLRELLSNNEYVLSGACSAERLYLEDVHAKFPIECLKEDYAIYEVEEGGYYYVFWNDYGYGRFGDGLDLSQAQVEQCWYIPRICVESDFDSVVMGVTTVNDIKAIDPTVILSYGLDSFGGALSRGHEEYCHVVLTDDEYFFIGFDYVENQLVVTEMEIVEGDDFWTWRNDIAKEDWPIQKEEEKQYETYEDFLEQINNPIDGTGMIPLVFVDTAKEDQVGYLICAGNNGEVYIADWYEFNGKSLYWESHPEFCGIDYQKGPYSTEILDLSKPLVFRDFKGGSVTAKVQQLTGEYIGIINFLLIRTHMNKALPADSRLWFGTYEGIDMFPDDAVYTDDGIIVDLDGDGDEDQIRVELTQVPDSYTEDPFTGYTGYYYTYEYFVTKNGRTFRFKPFKSQLHVTPDDFAVYVADVDLDGEYEIIEFMYYYKRFGGISIYDFNGATYDELIYSIAPQN